jgi:DNA primase
MSDAKFRIVKDILGECIKSGNEYLFHCVYCNHHKKKLSVNFAKDKYKCWVCDKSGKISRIVKRFGTFLQQQTWKELTGQVDITDFERLLLGQEVKTVEVERTMSLPAEFVSLCNNNPSLSSIQPRNYLSARGIDKQQILHWKLGYCPTGEYAGRIIAPSFNMDGKVNFFVGRAYDGHWRKYMNPPANKDIIFNELYIDWEEDITLVEGVFDAVKVPNSIPILGSSLREASKLFMQIVQNDPRIYVALDPDVEKKAYKLIESLLRYDIEVYKVPIKPFKDVGEMSKEEFLRRKATATLFKNTDNILLERIMGI